MTRYEKFSRAVGVLLATLVAIFTLNATANAVQLLTFPSAVNIPYTLAAGGTSAPIATASNYPITLMGIGDTAGDRGVGFVHLLHVPSSFIEWTGADIATNAITQGFSGTAGTHIVWLDYTSKLVDVEVNGTDTMVVHNIAGVTESGSITLLF